MGEIIGFLNKDLDEFKYVSPNCFHRFNHKFILFISKVIWDTLWIEIIDMEKVWKNILKIGYVHVTYTLSYSLVDFYIKVQTLYDIRVTKTLYVLFSTSKYL